MINIIIGVLILGLSVPLILGKIPPNRWYGMRVPAAYKSDEHWYKINRYGGWHMAIWGVILIAVGIVPKVIDVQMNVVQGVLYLLAPLTLVIPVIMTLMYSFKIDK